MGSSNFNDDSSNYLFVHQDEKGRLLDHIFIHIGNNENTSFLTHFDLYDSDMPLEVYRLEKVNMSTELIENFISTKEWNCKDEQTWKRIRVNGALPSTWKFLFESIEDKLRIAKK